MNTDIFEGNWKQFEGKAKEKWGKITGDSWTQIKGKRDSLLGKIQESYGRTRDEAEKELSAWEKEQTVTTTTTTTTRKAS